ncbi:MAG: glycosyltransferase [Clostridia bacterium]|nr:glycosyltransferase [Clostridia bacterium]
MAESVAKISIIMGIYNCADTLAEAIDSILAQTYPHWKLIMCDDGSADDTYEIAKQYAEKYPEKIIVIKNEKNKGLNYTLNHCLKYADTEYIARMDGDDISLPQRFEKEIEFLENNPQYSIVSCPMIYFDETGDFRTGKVSGEPNINNIAKGTPFCHAPCLVKAETYHAVNGYAVDDKRLRVEDWDLWVRMYEKGYRGYNLSEPLYKMRDDRNAYSRRKFKYRINEARVTASAIKKLKLSKKYYIWMLRPIIVGLLPKSIYTFLHKRKLSKR